MKRGISVDILTIINTLMSTGALCVAVIALYDTRKQAKQARFDKVRPFLVPMNAPVFEGDPQRLKCGVQDITLNNVGESIALNVASTLLGCESCDGDSDKPGSKSSFEQECRTLWLNIPILPSSGVKCAYVNNNGLFREGNRQIVGYSLFAPPEPKLVDLKNGASLHITARLIITYHDIFNKKYVNIYDYVKNIGWRLAKFTDVQRDLYDLESSNTKRNSLKEAQRVTYSNRIY
jgi:hypothetical protein